MKSTNGTAAKKKRSAASANGGISRRPTLIATKEKPHSETTATMSARSPPARCALAFIGRPHAPRATGGAARAGPRSTTCGSVATCAFGPSRGNRLRAARGGLARSRLLRKIAGEDVDECIGLDVLAQGGVDRCRGQGSDRGIDRCRKLECSLQMRLLRELGREMRILRPGKRAFLEQRLFRVRDFPVGETIAHGALELFVESSLEPGQIFRREDRPQRQGRIGLEARSLERGVDLVAQSLALPDAFPK